MGGGDILMSATYTVGQVLPNGATVTKDTFVTLATGATVETVIETYPNGSHNQTVITTPGPTTPAVKQATMTAKVTAAITANQAWATAAAKASYPLSTAEQQNLVNHVVTLTKQVNALAKLYLGLTATTTGT